MSLIEHICQECGKTFMGGPTARYCPDCRIVREQQRRQARKEKKTVAVERVCQECGKIFMGGPGTAYCSECRLIRARATVVKERICKECGKTFMGGPRAWYCPDCRIVREKNSNANFRAKGRRAERPIGSIDHCEVCGKEYVVNSARQKYCPDCAHEAVRKIDREASKKWNQEHKEVYYPKMKEKMRAYPKACKVCGRIFLPNGSPTQCCSDECRRELKRQRQKRGDDKRHRRTSAKDS